MRSWYLAYTKPNKERQVASALYLRGIEVYLPLVWVNPVNPRSARERPYFSGCLFAQLDLLQAAPNTIRWTPGFKGMVEYDGAPAIVPDDILFELRQQLGRIRAVSGMTFETGPAVEHSALALGPFAGYEALFNSRLSGAERARVLGACIHHHCWQRNQSTAVSQPGRAAG